MIHSRILCTAAIALVGMALSPRPAPAAPTYQVWVSNEKSGDVTIIDGSSLKVIGTLSAGKRPRGIHSSPDGKSVYVALSGTPIEGPPRTLTPPAIPSSRRVMARTTMTTTTKSYPINRPTVSASSMSRTAS